jgi:endonuclease/exonuclease/phosphatase family metal-dependent hydrolase
VLSKKAARALGCAVVATLLATGSVVLCQAAPAAAPVRVLTWNVHGIFFTGAGKRLTRIAAAVAEQRPDFVAFQEVWTTGQASILRHALEPIGYASYRYTRGFLRRGGLLLLWDTTKGWSVTDASFVRYERAAPWWRLNEMDGLGRKGFLVASARHPDGRAARIVVTHLQSQYPNHHRTYDDIRLAQIQQLAAAVDGGTEALIVAGDFNTMPYEKSGGYTWLRARGWRDATAEFRRRCEAMGSLPCGTSFDADGRTADWIDYIFIRGDSVSAGETELIRNIRGDDPYSDHGALLSSLTVAAQ